MTRSINGKSIGTVMEELSAPFDERLFRENDFGHHYLPVEAYRERLDTVVGTMNYDVTTSHPEIETVGSRPQVMLKAAIAIRDDNGDIVVIKESPGGCPVILSSSSGEAVSVRNDEESAASDAFKRCCKLLGMAGKQLKELRKGMGGSSARDGEVRPTEYYKVVIRENFKKLGKDGYAASVAIDGGEVTKLVIWKEAQDKIEETIPMDEFLRLGVPGKSFCLYGRKSTFTPKGGNPQNQLIMEAPYRGE